MSQAATQQNAETKAAIDEFRKAGVPIESARRPFFSKRMTGFNASVYANWIPRWSANAAANYPVIKGSAGVGFLRECAKGVPAVCVGIGPSLDDEIESLHGIDKHAILIATDAALRPLLRCGIVPDIVLSFDARDEQRTMWESIENLTKEIVLLANSCTSPLTIAAWQGPIMFFNMIQGDDEFATNVLPSIYPFIDGIPNAGTVGNGAVLLANIMGCKPILTVGMDLCYREESDTQGDGLDARVWRYRCRDWKLVNTKWLPIDNKVLYDNAERMAETFDEEIKGKIFRVDLPLQYYRNSLVSNVGQADIKLVNCSGGALTDLVKTMRLQKARDEFCSASLSPGRTIAKHLIKLVPAANRDWKLIEDARLFVPKGCDEGFL